MVVNKLVVNKGDRYNKLTIVKEVDPRIEKNGKKKRKFEVKCDCGNTKFVMLAKIRNGSTKSCGCFRGTNSTHGHTKGNKNTPTYNSYIGMKQRCYYTKHKFYDNYGGRGIEIFQPWLDCFENFLKDMGERPEGHSIDRIDSDGDYTPDNCKWSTHSEQMKNRRSWAKKKKNQIQLKFD